MRSLAGHNLAEAVQCFKRSLELDPSESSNVLCNLGLAYFDQGMHAHAIACFDKAIEADARSVEALVLKGDALLSMGRLKESEEYFNKALLIQHDDSSAWSARGACLRRQVRNITIYSVCSTKV